DDTWIVTIGGQASIVTPEGSFRVYNISAPDQFGVGGPGTAPDFLSDDLVRVIGQSTSNGVTRYAFSDHFQFSRGQTFAIAQMTITETPPPMPVSLRMTVDNPTLSTSSQTTQLHVTGTLQDNSQVDLTPRTSWTVYRTSN